jgi:hypothetical protein
MVGFFRSPEMLEWIALVGAFVLYFAIMRWVLPRLGVST